MGVSVSTVYICSVALVLALRNKVEILAVPKDLPKYLFIFLKFLNLVPNPLV